jgi:hypothetical protein
MANQLGGGLVEVSIAKRFVNGSESPHQRFHCSCTDKPYGTGGIGIGNAGGKADKAPKVVKGRACDVKLNKILEEPEFF